MANKARINVRQATNADGPIIKELCLLSGFVGLGDIDFSEVAPHWLVASKNDDPRVVGAIEVLLGKPIGRLELMCFDPTLQHIERAKVMQQLIINGMATLQIYGSSMVSGLIPFNMKGYKRIFKNRGGVVLTQGNMMAKRLK